MSKSISIIYVYYNTPHEILDSINSLRSAASNYEVIIVNNKSTRPLPEEIKKKKHLKIIDNIENVGFGKAANQAVKLARGTYVMILNPDTVCYTKSIDLMVARMQLDKTIGVLGPQQVNKQGEILHSIGSMPMLPDAIFVFSFLRKIWPKNPYKEKFWAKGIDRTKEQETETIGGACMLFPKKIFDAVGGFDERFFMYFEEADICLRIKKLGYKIFYYPKAKIMHLVGKSTSDKDWIKKTFEKSRYEFFKKYYPFPTALLSELFLRLF